MCNSNVSEEMELIDRIQARKRHEKSLETKLKRVEFDYARVPLKRKAAYVELFRYLIPTSLLSVIEVTCLGVWISTIVSVVKADGKATPVEGLVILLGALFLIFVGYKCVKNWLNVSRIIIYFKDLKEEELQLATKQIILTEKLEECRAELNALIEKQKQIP